MEYKYLLGVRSRSVCVSTIAPDGVTVVAGDGSGRVHFLRLEGLRG